MKNRNGNPENGIQKGENEGPWLTTPHAKIFEEPNSLGYLYDGDGGKKRYPGRRFRKRINPGLRVCNVRARERSPYFGMLLLREQVSPSVVCGFCAPATLVARTDSFVILEKTAFGLALPCAL